MATCLLDSADRLWDANCLLVAVRHAIPAAGLMAADVRCFDGHAAAA